ncbi:MAG: 3-deoxy-D-manno-octulosonic acid transferase [Acidobacteriota bacterium]
MWWLYQAAMAGALLLAGPFLLIFRGRHYLETLSGRLGGGSSALRPGALWIHAVSVGEAGVAATLARALPADIPLVVTTVTPTGQARARTALAGRADVAYLPFDLGFAIRRFWRRFEPRALVLVEGDLWPLVLRTAKRRGLPILVVNGRVSDRGVSRLGRLGALRRPLLDPVDRFAVQTDGDRDRLTALGVPAERIAVTGNLKYDIPAPSAAPELLALVERLAGERPVLIAGSTMGGEEEQVLAAFAAAGGGGAALLVLAPRHPERWDAVEVLARSAGFTVRRRSAGPGPETERPAVVLLDSMGELAGLYAAARGAFVGGTLVPTGGHNPIEPARFGIAVAAGPAMENFREIAEQFDAARAWRRVASAAELGDVFAEWLHDPAQARQLGARAAALVDSNRGALERTLAELAPYLRGNAK